MGGVGVCMHPACTSRPRRWVHPSCRLLPLLTHSVACALSCQTQISGPRTHVNFVVLVVGLGTSATIALLTASPAPTAKYVKRLGTAVARTRLYLQAEKVHFLCGCDCLRACVRRILIRITSYNTRS